MACSEMVYDGKGCVTSAQVSSGQPPDLLKDALKVLESRLADFSGVVGRVVGVFASGLLRVLRADPLLQHLAGRDKEDPLVEL